MQSLTVFKCMDGNEFNLAVRSLAVWLKRHKGVGLVVLDGMQFVENADFLSQYERKQNKHLNASADQAQDAGHKISSIEQFAG